MECHNRAALYDANWPSSLLHGTRDQCGTHLDGRAAVGLVFYAVVTILAVAVVTELPISKALTVSVYVTQTHARTHAPERTCVYMQF